MTKRPIETMPHLRFPYAEVAEIVAHGLSAPRQIPGTPSGTDCMLVGDQGVYIMSAGQPPKPGKDGRANHVAYAVGCNPGKDAFDDWWELKRDTFGPDDGIEPLTLADMIGKAKGYTSAPQWLVVGFDGGNLVIEIEVETV